MCLKILLKVALNNAFKRDSRKDAVSPLTLTFGTKTWIAYMKNSTKFPGGSKSRVNRVGVNIRNGTSTESDLKVLEEWRSAHRAVLNTFQAILRNRTSGLNITVAQRHKRKSTIIDKLFRYP
jgi:hypothetical protein